MKQLLDQTVEAYQRSLDITQNQYKSGIVAKADVITAETQLEGAQSQQISVGVMRGQLEHAIAVLVGKPPADFAIEAAAFGTVSGRPHGDPVGAARAPARRGRGRTHHGFGQRADRRCDRRLFSGSDADGLVRVQQQRAQRADQGAEQHLVLRRNGRGHRARLRRALRGGAAGARRLRCRRRQLPPGVLTAFQQVEDQLVALRILEQQYAVQDRTVKSANEAVRLTINEYKAGTVAYTAVVTAQATALADAQTLLTIRQNRLTASVALIQALGGGWDAALLKTAAPRPMSAGAPLPCKRAQAAPEKDGRGAEVAGARGAPLR
jgi:hypothetical protein